MFNVTSQFAGSLPFGMFSSQEVPFGLATLQADPNCVLIQDPSAVWGVQDFLPRRNLLLSTDTLATQNVTVVATAYKLYMQGTGSITLSGTGSGTLNGTGANDRVSLSFTPTAGTLTLTVSGTVTYGMLTRADTIDQSYQKITDWTTEQYAWAAAKQVPWLRRNMLAYTEGAFNNATYWPKGSSGSASAPVITDDYADGPFPGTRASRAVFSRTGTTASDYSYITSASITIPAGTQDYHSIYIKSNTGASQALIFYPAGYSGSTPLTITVTTEWQRFKVGSNTNPGTARIFVLGTRGGSGQYYTGGDLTCDVQICCAQMALADVSYQRILADWDTTYTAAAIAAGYPISIWQDSAATTAVSSPDQVIGKVVDLSTKGNNLSQSTTADKPLWKLDANGKAYIAYMDGTDKLSCTFPNYGANCTTYTCDGSTVTETTGVTINGATNIATPTTDYGRVYFSGPPPSYAAKLKKWLLAKAGK